MVEFDIKECILDVLNAAFLAVDKLAAATSGIFSYFNESFHNSTNHVLGAKQTFRAASETTLYLT